MLHTQMRLGAIVLSLCTVASYFTEQAPAREGADAAQHAVVAANSSFDPHWFGILELLGSAGLALRNRKQDTPAESL